jgi:hypothetical protein
MREDYEKKREKQASLLRTILNYGMGILFVFLGVLIFFHERLNLTLNERFSTGTLKVFGIIFMLYGVWRIYRGYKKN